MMRLDAATLRVRLANALDAARCVAEADKGKPSADFDAGRYDGLKQAIEILDGIGASAT
jgi:hypothetical protein